MYPLIEWQEFRISDFSFQKSHFQFSTSGSRSDSFERKIPDYVEVPISIAVLACEPDESLLDSEGAFGKARRFHLEYQNMKEAEYWYRIAAEEKHPDASFHLGVLYETHFRDLTQAKFFYQKAIQDGNSYACNNLALLIWSESGPTPEVEKLLKQSQECGNVLSSGALVLYYEAVGKIIELKQTARLFFLNLSSEEDTNNRALGIVLDCILRQKEFGFLRSQFLKPGSLLMKKALPYWHVLEIIRRANNVDTGFN